MDEGECGPADKAAQDAEDEGKDAEEKDAEKNNVEGQDDEAGVDQHWFPDEEWTENSQRIPSSRSHLAQHYLRDSNITTKCASIIQSFATDHREEWEDAQELNFDGTVHSSNGPAVRLYVMPTRALS